MFQYAEGIMIVELLLTHTHVSISFPSSVIHFVLKQHYVKMPILCDLAPPHRF